MNTVKSNGKKLARILGVVGTGTEVGKTIIAASLARTLTRMGWRIGVFKPFASDPARRADGTGFSTDADLLARAANFPGGADAACGQLFRAPLAPLAAAEAEGRKVDLNAALRQARRMASNFDLTLVEGCGGWEVPLTWKSTTADFFEKLGAPLVIVARADLGTINHTLLTLAAIRARSLRPLGVILNGRVPATASASDAAGPPPEASNPAILRRFAGLPIWGPVPFKESLSRPTGDAINEDELHALDGIADELIRQLHLTC